MCVCVCVCVCVIKPHGQLEKGMEVLWRKKDRKMEELEKAGGLGEPTGLSAIDLCCVFHCAPPCVAAPRSPSPCLSLLSFDD